MSDDEYGSPEVLLPPGTHASGGGRNHTPSHRKGPRFSWTPAYETTFFQSLAESVKIGLKDNHSFKSEAWDRACEALANRHGAYPNKSHLINKSDNARKKFRLWRGLREDPEFLYNPTNRTVTASEDSWKKHIEREPLSKSLRNRPFEHEAFMEILFPDVIGSGGAPKRITKPRRKGIDPIPDSDDIDTPGTNVLNLLSPGANQTLFQTATSQTPIQPPTLPSNGTIRPSSTTIPTRTSIASSSALTPPDEEAPHPANSRKRYLPPNTGAAAPGTSEKRRRTGNNNNNYIDLTYPGQIGNMENSNLVQGSNNNNGGGGANPHGGNNASDPQSTSNAVVAVAGTTTTTTNNNNMPGGGGPGAITTRQQQFQDAMIGLGTLRPVPPPTNWPQQAMEIFFRDFSDEDQDLQIKIGEKVLCDGNKAMMFCVMPHELRKHWVKRLRELHNRLDAAGVGSSSSNSAAATTTAAALASSSSASSNVNGGGSFSGAANGGMPHGGGGGAVSRFSA